MQYLTHADRAATDTSCIFCVKAAAPDAREHILYRGESSYVTLNRYPYNNGHLMVVPYAHVPSLEDLDPLTLAELMQLLKQGLAALRVAMGPEGFNVGANLGQVAGAGVEAHVHLHVVPRWSGDTNFMPIIGDMRVIPQTWLQTYDELKAALKDPC